MSSSKIIITYATSNPYKRQEVEIIEQNLSLSDDRKVADLFDFNLVSISVKETLEVDLATMVTAEVTDAYRRLRVPCIVEHAGLIFETYEAKGYPGGLTKPMWDTLGESFPAETQSANRRTIARAVVGYCDGQQVHVFAGETAGHLADEPRGDRAFYWDTVFIPDIDGKPGVKTYAEIVSTEGLERKVLDLSQSTKAMTDFLQYRAEHAPQLWTTV